MEKGVETWGQTSKETWSDCKPGVQGVKWCTCQITGATRSEGALVPEVEVSGTGGVTVRESCKWSDWYVSITQLRPFFDLLTSLDTQVAQNLRSPNKKQIRNNSNFNFFLNIKILCIYTKYRSCPSFSTRLIHRSLIFPHYPGAP